MSEGGDINGGLEFLLLGPLEARMDGRELNLGGPRQRAVLAMLLLSADRVVSVEDLMEAVWEGRPPTTSRTQVAICIAGLRKLLRTAGCPTEVIVTSAPGYMLRSLSHRIDSLKFQRALAAADEMVTAGRVGEAIEQLERALKLWRGPALADLSIGFIENEAALLAEQRLAAHELSLTLRLRTGEHVRLISELTKLLREHPLREQTRAALMLAQYRAGRRAEALETFRDGRRLLIEELGIEPGPELQALHDQILHDSPALVHTSTMVATRESIRPPAQLPSNIPAFAGRSRELRALDRLLEDCASNSPVAVGFVTGRPGVGKTGLAVHWAHRVASSFPDGQLFIDIGMDKIATGEHREASPNAIVEWTLRALEVPSSQIPADLGARVALYRSILATRRMLIVLDNAETYAQVWPLVPGNGACCLLVTSRVLISELLDHHAALWLNLGPLEPQEAAQLLGELVSASRVAADPVGAARLIDLCDRLPLTLRVVAAKLAVKPHWSLRHLAGQVRDHAGRRDRFPLNEDDLCSELRRSYHGLKRRTAVMYRRLALVERADFDAADGAALLDISDTEAEHLIEELVDAKLVEVHSCVPGEKIRYRFQDQVRLSALDVVRERDGYPDRVDCM